MLAGAALLNAQETRGTILGRITDVSGGVVAGVKIRARNLATNVANEAQSNDQGNYQLPFLVAGDYAITVENAGFKKIEQSSVRLSLNDAVTLNFSLEPGAISESITVSAAAPMLNSANADIAQVISNAYVNITPVALSRNILDMIRLAPGVQGGGGSYASNGQKDFSINGGGSTTGRNEVIVDGVPDTLPQGGGNVVYTPSMDSVEEVRVMNTMFDAAYGHSNAGGISITTKGGGNRVHGTVYDYKRWAALNANSWTNNRSGVAKAPVSYNQVGATASGPVYLPKLYDGRDRTFFAYSIELNSTTFDASRQGRVPTDLERQGDFSQTLARAGGPLTIYDPATSVIAAGKVTRTQFPGNRIPQARLNTTGSTILNQYPQATIPGAAPINGINFYASAPESTDISNTSYRIDHALSAKQRLFGRYAKLSYDQSPSKPWVTEYREGGNGDFIHRDFFSVTLDDTYTISPSMVASVRYGMVRRSEYTAKGTYNLDVPALPLPKAIADSQYLPGYPIFRLNENIAMIGSGYRPESNDVHSVLGTVSKLSGAHSLKFGVDYRLSNRNPFALGTSAPGDFTFSPIFTQADPFTNSSSDRSGSAMASLLLGLPASGSLGYTSPLATRSHSLALFLQEDWKLTRRLTVNVGLRYDLETPFTERYNRVAYGFDSNAPLPVKVPGLDLRGGALFAGVNGISRYTGPVDKNNFGPRFGLAYLAGKKTVIRAGYGLFYSAQSYNTDFLGSVGAFDAVTPVVGSTDGGATPFATLNNPFPNGLVKPVGSEIGLMAQVGSSLSYFDSNRVSPYNQQWQFGVQHELPGQLLVEGSYIGMLNVKQFESFNQNEKPDRYLALGSAENTSIRNPFYDIFPAASTLGGSPTIQQKQLWYQYPQFTSLTVQGANTGVAIYHALQAKVEKRMTHGLTILWTLSHSKLIDNNTTSIVNERHYRSVSSLDRLNLMRMAFTYQLPIRFRGGFSQKLLDAIAGGWETGGFLTLESGAPLSISDTNGRPIRLRNATKSGAISDRIGDQKGPAAVPLNPYFDITAFQRLASQYTIAPDGPTLDELRAPGVRGLNLSLGKMFPIREWIKLKIRFEATGVTNTPNFGSPGTNMASASTFGVITSAGGSRQMQASARLEF